MWIVCDILRVVVPRWRACVMERRWRMRLASKEGMQECLFLFRTPDMLVARLLSQQFGYCCWWLVGCGVSSSATEAGVRAEAQQAPPVLTKEGREARGSDMEAA